jgi:hypothetical protein
MHSSPSVRSLLGSWLTLSRWIFHTVADRLREMSEESADGVRDAMLDFSIEADGPSEPVRAAPLPPLAPEQLALALRHETEEVFRQAADVLNEDPAGCWSEATEARVLALFEQLGRQALEQAFEVCMAALEARLPAESLAPGRWARKYRRMQGAQGNWPPPDDPGQ